MTIANTYENYSANWWTPDPWLAWVAESFLGKPYHDPCPQNYKEGDNSGLMYRGGYDSPKPAYWNHPGSRGSTAEWWRTAILNLRPGAPMIWCAFSDEQVRHMRPSCYALDGWMILPRDRIGFVWGGPDMAKKGGKLVEAKKGDKVARAHGEVAKSPGNWTVFWSSVKPAPLPSPCTVVRTRSSE